ncbi:FMRFamide-activated amiloride-sensitive sodium channel-like isoform X1 [Mytilus galloprovincialis]|uniref:FMRFamide-activated amiloride-sensitive sodium channel-like isoform X1 n=1 Tax=Mytilus galloprovincialis TaxID=29158 RepID=UPI003F7BF26D
MTNAGIYYCYIEINYVSGLGITFMSNWGFPREHMKYIALRKLNYIHDHLRMVKDKGSRRNQTALNIITELGAESTAHGLSKVATSIKTKRKVMWALLVIVGFTAATLQLSLLVKKYLQFSVVEVSEMKTGMPVEFPAVTICNIQAISLTKIKHQMERRHSKVVDWFKFQQCSRFGEQQIRMESTQAFFENLNSEAMASGHDINDILLHCRFNQHKCNASKFTHFFDGQNYFNCYTFNSKRLAEKILIQATGPEYGLSVVIALDNDDPPLGAYGLYDINNNIAHSAGLRVQVHAPNTMPSPVDHGFDIPPGFSSSVGLKAVINTRLPYPYGNCTNELLYKDSHYSNTIFACLQLCKQEKVIEKCKCKSSGLPDLQNRNLSYCGSMKNWREIFEKMDCEDIGGHDGTTKQRKNYFLLPDLKCEQDMLRKLANDRSYEAGCGCYQPCQETTYQKALSLSYWPLEFFQQNALAKFYNKTQLENTFLKEAYNYLRDHVTQYEELYNDPEAHAEKLYHTNINLTERQRLIRASTLIHQNLIRLNIYLEDLNVVEFKQSAAYEIEDLFADIGGTLGLWMGISVLTIMELIELVIQLIILLFNSEKKIPQPNDPVPNGPFHGMMDQNDHYDPYNKRSDFESFDKAEYYKPMSDLPEDSPV